MKKAVKFLLTACLACTMLFGAAACGNGNSSGVAGEYKVVVDTTSMTESEAALTNSLLGSYTMTLSADGKASVTAMGTTNKGTWKENGDKVEVTIKEENSNGESSESTETFTKDGNKLKSTTQSQLVFEKK